MTSGSTPLPLGPPRVLKLGGKVAIIALEDAVAEHPRRIEECFPAEPADGWEAVKSRYPETISPDGRWLFPVFTYLVRTPAMTMLVDTGVGPRATPAGKLFGATGRLPEALAEFGLALATVDVVAFTHLHQDHVGWASDPDTGKPTFPNARYLVSRREWNDTSSNPGSSDWIAPALGPVDELGQLGLVDPGPIADGVELIPLPGHTAGHCGILVTGLKGRIALVGDAFNHRQQVADPGLPSLADRDREQAAATRRGILDHLRSGDWDLAGSAHLPGAWWSPGAASRERR